MTRKGVVVVQVEGLIPDRWMYSFDGEKLKFVEEFDDAPEGVGSDSKRVASVLGFNLDGITDNKMEVELPADQERAVSAVTSEIIMQAYTLGIISHELFYKVLEELTRPALPALRVPSIPAVDTTKDTNC